MSLKATVSRSKTKPAARLTSCSEPGAAYDDNHRLSPRERALTIYERPRPDLLPKYERLRQQLAACSRIDEVAQVKNKTEAMRAAARIIHDIEAEIWMADIKLRAARRLGEIIRGLEKAPGRPGKNLPDRQKNFKCDALKKAGISVSSANEYERIASIPSQEFDDRLNRARADRKPVTFREMLRSVITRRTVSSQATGLGWRHTFEHTCAPDPSTPSVLRQVDALLRVEPSCNQLLMILIIARRLASEPLALGRSRIENWYLKLLTHVFATGCSEESLEDMLECLFARPEADRERYLKRLMRDEDQEFGAIDPSDDLTPILEAERRRESNDVAD